MSNIFIPVSEPNITQKEVDYVLDAVRSGWISSLGEYISKFEDKFARFLGVKYAVSVSSGTAGLHLALLAIGVGQGDEVIIPDLTFVATANAVTYTGASPVMVDVDPLTWCIDPLSIIKAVTPRTRCIIPVHLYGQPADMDTIGDIARKHKLVVIEDSAEAHGALYKGKRTGSIGACGVFSFYGNKIVTTGEGGMVTTNDKSLFVRLEFLRDHAMSKEKRYWHEELGFNYRLTNLQAALGLAQLERIEELLEKKKQIFNLYRDLLKDVKMISLNPQVSWAENVFWMVCLLLDKRSPVSRDEMALKLKQAGIDTRPFFYPLSKMPLFKNAKNVNNPISNDLSARGLNLPSATTLKLSDVYYIAKTIKEILS